MFKKVPIIIYVALLLLACTEEIDKSNRYVFTGETVADYMLNRSEKYSHMITLMKRAGIFSLMQTWGQYTLFLPDNESVEKFVAEQDSIYHATKDTYNPVWTGITSPLFEDLSDSMATVIARAHVIEKSYLTADMGEGAIGKWNFNDRALSVSYKVVDERFYIMINNHSAIIDGDNQVENGIVHLIDKPIDPKYRTVSNQIAAHPFFSIFTRPFLKPVLKVKYRQRQI
ncbi:MAG: fasciclin domain-containing protein [Bacteroidaceae bacterium]|nr:fasciclin domain-containing protein [Bacteroidaceae bacterium]